MDGRPPRLSLPGAGGLLAMRNAAGNAAGSGAGHKDPAGRVDPRMVERACFLLLQGAPVTPTTRVKSGC